MSSNIPGPPPPPPPPLITATIAPRLSTSDKLEINEEDYYRIIKRIIKDEFGDATDESQLFVVLSSKIIKPVLQDGPLCGLVALSMAGQIMNIEADPGKILDLAIKKGYSKKGEMFSAENLSNLAKDLYNCSTRILETQEGGFLKKFILNCLAGNPILVPYDADFNHRPSKRKGHAAHWCLLHGIGFISVQNTKITGYFGASNSPEESILLLKTPLSPEALSKSDLINALPNSPSDIFVLANQGKSLHLGIWNLKDLIESNQNLVEISPKIIEKKEDYVLSDITKQLSSLLVIIEKYPIKIE